MNWKDLKTSVDNTHFIYNENPAFDKKFKEVLKYHAPGIAPVKDTDGCYHITVLGNELYSERYDRTFGFYCNRAAVVYKNEWFHINENGQRVYYDSYAWTGNFQEDRCTVRDKNNNYFHITPEGKRLYTPNHLYCGDFKDGIACVKTANGLYKHITLEGYYLNDKTYHDLGVFHKNYATAKDKNGWFHIDIDGNEVYLERYLAVEPFYNGYALVTKNDNQKFVINELGNRILVI